MLIFENTQFHPPPSLWKRMLLLLLLVFPLNSVASKDGLDNVPDKSHRSIKLDDLKFPPSKVTKESILADYKNLTEHELGHNLFSGVAKLAFVSSWYPLGYPLIRKTVQRLTHVSPVWFEVLPIYNDKDQIYGIDIEGHRYIDVDLLKQLRKENPIIKIVPRFRFDAETWPRKHVWPLKNSVWINEIARKIAIHCTRWGFEGLVLDAFDAFSSQDSLHTVDSIEAFAQMGDVFEKHGLERILSMRAPVPIREDAGSPGKLLFTKQQCTDLLGHYDYVQLRTYNDQTDWPRKNINEWVEANLQVCDMPRHVMVGINFYGQECSKSGVVPGNSNSQPISAQRFLEVLNLPDSELTFDPETVEHSLVRGDIMIFFPTVTTLEYRMRHAVNHKASLSIWDYGQGLDYFADLI